MKHHKIVLFLLLCLFIASSSFAIMGIKAPGPSVDSVDPTLAAKAKESQSVNPTKIANQPGRIKLYSLPNTFGFGLLGPDTATTNIYFKPAEELPSLGDTLIFGTPNNTTINGEVAVECPFTYGPGGGGSSVAINGSTVTSPNFINTTELNVTNNSGSISSTINNGSISISKLSAASITNTSEMNSVGVTNLDDNTLMTAGAVYALLAQILGLPDLSIVTPVANAWVNNSSTVSGTATDDTTISSVEWKLESGGTYTTTGVTGTSNWSITGINWGTDGVHNLYVRVNDNEGNSKESIVTVNSDNTDPIGVADADGTHDGVSTFTASVTVTETNLDAVTFIATNCSPSSGSCSLSGGKYVTPSLTPSGTSTVTVTFAIADLSGRTASGTDLIQSFTYSGVSDCLIYWDAESTAEAVSSLTVSMPDADGVRSTDAEYAGSYGFRSSGNGGRAVFTSGTTFDVGESGYVSFWVHASVADITSTSYLFQIVNSTYETNNRISLNVGTSELLQFSIRANGTSYYATAPSNTAYNTIVSGYTFVECIWTGNSMTLKVNGSTVASNSTTRGAMTNTLNAIGIANEFEYNTYGMRGDYDNFLLSGGGSTACP